MTKTELLNQCARSGEERILLARVLDKLDMARNRGVPAYTAFLSPGERAAVEALLNAAGHPRHVFYGGYEGAERTLCFFLPDWQEEDDLLAGELPLVALRASFRAESTLTHRDFLGSILGQGITREKVGDLLVDRGKCDILVQEEIADFLLQNLLDAGRTRLSVKRVDLAELAPRPPELKTVKDTVATLRLDAVAATGFSLPRGKAADLISSGKLQLNHRECTKPDKLVAQGDVLSCRGLGKCVVKEAGRLSKKGRVMIELERYL